jgi:steroid delta-isomerase-like uncharacterized protein
MASQKVESVRARHDAFNRRDFDAALNGVAEHVTYRDRARGETYEGHDGFTQWLRTWPAAFSDGRVADPTYVDAGDVVIAEFAGRGTNDGPLGDLPPTGRTIDVPFCEITRFDANGEVVEAAIYYDQLSMMAQLGHIEAGATTHGAR